MERGRDVSEGGGCKRWRKIERGETRAGTSSEESGSERSSGVVLERLEWMCDAKETRKEERKRTLPLRQINHISRVCSSLSRSLAFYRDVLGFVEIKRPDSFDFDGAWLFNYGIGIHLLKLGHRNATTPSTINPKGDHISFTCCSLNEVESCLTTHGINYVKSSVVENMTKVEQVFFHDPDGNMIEVCTCDCLPMTPLGSGMQCMRRCPSFNVGEGTMEQIVEELQRQQIIGQVQPGLLTQEH